MWGRDERKCSGWFESLERWRTKKTTLWQTPFWLGATKIGVDTRGVQCDFFPPSSSSEQQQRVSWSLIRHRAWHISSFCSTHKGRKAPVEGRCWTRSKRHRLTETWIHIFLTRGQEHALVLLCPSWFTTFGEVFSILINTDVPSLWYLMGLLSGRKAVLRQANNGKPAFKGRILLQLSLSSRRPEALLWLMPSNLNTETSSVSLHLLYQCISMYMCFYRKKKDFPVCIKVLCCPMHLTLNEASATSLPSKFKQFNNDHIFLWPFNTNQWWMYDLHATCFAITHSTVVILTHAFA